MICRAFVSLMTASLLVPAALAQTPGTLDKKLADGGYVDVSTLHPGIIVSLMYARDDNFTGRLLYTPGLMTRAWLHPDAAEALGRAAAILDSVAPGTRLLVKDAARPMEIQRRMFASVAGTPKARYVANPGKGGGLHNFGLAVDITLADAEGKELPMGTPVDHLGTEANIDREPELVARGVISENERQNRLLLRRVMRKAGFSTIRTEWWHFNLVSLRIAKTKYRLID